MPIINSSLSVSWLTYSKSQRYKKILTVIYNRSLESLNILQSRIEQLEGYEDDKPLSLSFGLYQGDKLKQKFASRIL